MTGSYWHTVHPPVAPASLPLPRRVDVAVIGAGFAGLSIAADLLESAPGIHIAVLEAHHPGFGASGRNAGGVLPLAIPQWLLPGRAGPLTGTAALAALHAVITGRMHRLATEHPAAEIRHTTMLLLAAHPPIRRALRWAQDRMATAGLHSTWWPPEQVAATGTLPRPALTFPAWTVHPAALATSLAGHARDNGAQILENRPVSAVEPVQDGIDVILRDGARLRADRVVITTGAYTSAIRLPDQIDGRVVHATMQADSPDPARNSGSAELFAAAVAINPAYWRIHNGRLLFGGADRARPAAGARRAVRRLRDRYLPDTAGAVPDLHWNGPILVRRGEVPLLARSPSSRRITYALGFAGSGVALATSAGPLVRDLVLGSAVADPAATTLRTAITATPTLPAGLLQALLSR